MRIDAAAVVGGQPVTNYEILPQQAGLVQLLIDGALVRNDRGDFVVARKPAFPAAWAALTQFGLSFPMACLVRPAIRATPK